ncbi:MAG: tRNA 2-selenouridine(34) synthase MnmH [Bdellovibrionaceae bacterium]|nr:tRNA 2-selenouridine(34) synthase MnmH [Bdellovibrio sp.]
MPTISENEFKDIILKRTPILDVRAQVEFAQGRIPGSINLPILNDEHRHEIGVIYKQSGNEAAVRRGHELVTGDYKAQLLAAWENIFKTNSNTVLTCFRGGQRSQISQSWLSQLGMTLPRIAGGYKAFRQYLINEMNRLSVQPMIVISGPTGSGKTKLIDRVKSFHPAIDLEKLAHHRGSAFGQHSEVQPAQADYENQLAQELLLIEAEGRKLPIVIEDESRMIGKTAQPEPFFNQLRASPLIYLEEPIESRVQVILEEYVLDLSPTERVKAYARYEKALQMISGKLGFERYEEIKHDLLNAIQLSDQKNDFNLHQVWIKKLLLWYYDPLYLKSFERRNPNVIFRGSRKAAEEFLRAQS